MTTVDKYSILINTDYGTEELFSSNNYVEICRKLNDLRAHSSYPNPFLVDNYEVNKEDK